MSGTVLRREGVSRPRVRDGEALTIEGVFRRVGELKGRHDEFFDY